MLHHSINLQSIELSSYSYFHGNSYDIARKFLWHSFLKCLGANIRFCLLVLLNAKHGCHRMDGCEGSTTIFYMEVPKRHGNNVKWKFHRGHKCHLPHYCGPCMYIRGSNTYCSRCMLDNCVILCHKSPHCCICSMPIELHFLLHSDNIECQEDDTVELMIYLPWL